MKWRWIIELIIAIATLGAAVAAWVAAKSSKKSAQIAKETSERAISNEFREELLNPINDIQGKAILKYKDGKTYYGYVEIDKYGNIICSKMYIYKPYYFPGLPVDIESPFFTPEEYIDDQEDIGDGRIWINHNDVISIFFIDIEVKNRIRHTPTLSNVAEDNPNDPN